jgi:hypothetical protein
MNPDVSETVIDLTAGDLDDVWVEVGSNGQEDDYDQGGRSPVREQSPSDAEEGVGLGGEQRRSRRGPLLERVRARLQNPGPGPFDREDLKWTKYVHSGRGGVSKLVHSGRGGVSKLVHTTIIRWNRLEDFVEGEETMRDFPCTLNRNKDPR